MSSISIEVDVTQYAVIPPEKNETNIFVLESSCMIINFCGLESDVLKQSEISREDAIELANLILMKYTK